MKIVQLEVKLTNCCNQRCFHCMNGDAPDGRHLLDTKIFIKRLEELILAEEPEYSIGEIRITGGEPLLYPAEIQKISSVCKTHGIPCGINTNGTLLTPDLAVELYNSGVTTIKTSLDAVDSELSKQIRGSSISPDRVLTSVRLANETGMRSIVRFTLSRKNRDQISSCLHQAVASGASEFQIKPLIRSGRAEGSDLFLSEQEVNTLLAEISRFHNPGSVDIVVLCWQGESQIGLKYKLCGSANKIYIDDDLRVIICNYVPDAECLGNLNEESLHTVLRNRERHLVETSNGHIVKGCSHVPCLHAPSS